MASNKPDESKPVVRLFFAKMKDAFLNLPDQEKMAFMKKDRANLDELGMKAISMIDCSTTGGEWDYIGVEGWSTMDAIEQRERFEQDELQLSCYVDYKTILGHEMAYEGYGQ